ncbi:hypothetical protein C5Z02_26160 [Bacteroides ovatus]|nr:hypothetical protein C5Z02_26160 [Bacteroides ovatus]
MFEYAILTAGSNSPSQYQYENKRLKKVSKGAWRMPWLSEAMKDVISCDKLRVVQITFDPKISEWTTRHSEGMTSCIARG